MSVSDEICKGSIFPIGDPLPAEVKHWHGAAPDSWLAHLAIEVPAKDASNEWLEEVSEEEYSKLS